MTKDELIDFLSKTLEPSMIYNAPLHAMDRFSIAFRNPEPPKTRGRVIAEKMLVNNVGRLSLYRHDRKGGCQVDFNTDGGFEATKFHALATIAAAIDAACAEAAKEEREACAKLLEDYHYVTVPGLIRARSTDATRREGE